MTTDLYHIIEVANTHGGNLKYLNALIDEFAGFQGNFGMKFQPFKYDRIAAEDFSWYETYKELYFTPEEWQAIIERAGRTKDIWLDMFDTYSVEILSANLEKVHGIKLQASVLYNFEMLDALAEVDLSNIVIQLNIAGYEVEEISTIVDRLKQSLSPKTFVIQFGFQNYPTEFNDAGLSKIEILKSNFPGFELCFADHLDGTSEEALIMPLIAAQAGCSYIEKHVFHDKMETKYDQFSSVNHANYTKMVGRIEAYQKAFGEPFINEREREYLEKSMQVPVLKNDLNAGDLVSLEHDVAFKRTDQKGLNVKELKELQKSFYILTVNKKSGETLKREDFKKAKTATIVACRMKSSRLPKKAILKIGDLTSIELCLKNLLKFENVDYTILATSTVEEDKQLENYTYSDEVIFHQGDPDDVIQRYLDIIDKLEIDVINRVTGDCPYLSKDIHDIILKSHFDKGADYSTAPEACIGMNVEVINTNVLREIKEYFPRADYSEYMTYYVTNNPLYFKINRIDLPVEYKRDYRITLDYQEDLDLFNEIEAYFKANEIEYSANELFKFLDDFPELAKSNQHCTVVYKDNDELIRRINAATTIKKES